MKTYLNLDEKDIQMLKKELGYSRCLYWDNKLEKNGNYNCNGECYECKNPYTINAWLENKSFNKVD